MKVLVILHAASEGPGTLGEHLVSAGADVRTVRLFAGEHLPAGTCGFSAVVTMGGPMSVDEEDKYPFLRSEVEFLRRAVGGGVPVLGICLGAQMIARACGAEVAKAPLEEVGWDQVCLTRDGRGDLLFRGLPEALKVFQWHRDTFDVPKGGLLLATSPRCNNQAFRYINSYGLQFHIEVTREMLAAWFQESPECGEILRQFSEVQDEFHRQGRRIWENFLSIMDEGLSIGK